MKIKKFTGKTEEEATKKAKAELGPSTVIMNVKKTQPSGFFKAFKSSTFEVTAAVEENEYKLNVSDAIKSQTPMHQTKINLAANEEIDIKNISNTTTTLPNDNTVYNRNSIKTVDPEAQIKKIIKEMPRNRETVADNMAEENRIAKSADMNGFEEKLDSLQSMLEENLKTSKEDNGANFDDMSENSEKDQRRQEGIKMAKMIYNTLLDNEVDEKYANILVEEMDKTLSHSSNIDMMLSNVYQKMILKFGETSVINLGGRKPKMIFFIGPTGVGKTTTIAKIASKFKVEEGRKIALFTADTYRIAAEEQLRTYANILDTPLTIIYSADELKQAIDKVRDVDVILVDTAGFSHKSPQQKEDTRKLIASLPQEIDKEVYLVVSATTKYRDLLEIADSYKEIADYKLIFTKLDETSAYGNLFNMRMYTGASMSYVTTGQNVPEDIEVFDTQRIVKRLLGGK
ncbi:MAG: flagellar biosynthesis protein FlhF [Lachnospiraceae bacterium]|nr:flagellar biosynthesis protein FlhF [Lachnospiraceae bacterium]